MIETMLPSPATATGATLGLLLEFETEHAIQRALCDNLETIADTLPAAPSPMQIALIEEQIERISKQSHPHAIAMLMALPAERHPSEEALAALTAMHSLDASHGDDLITALWNYDEEDPGRPESALGYMLRCYFDGCRRAIAFTEALVASALAPPAAQCG